MRVWPNSLKHVLYLYFSPINWNITGEKVCILTWYKTDFTLAMSIFMQSLTSQNLLIFFYVNNTQIKAFRAHTGKQYLWRVLLFLSPWAFVKDCMLKGCLPMVISDEQHFKHMANKYYLEKQLMNDLTAYFSDAFDSIGTRQMGDLLP